MTRRARDIGWPAWVGVVVTGGLMVLASLTIHAVLFGWIGVMAVGYGLGSVLTWPRERRHAFLLRAGAGLTVAFVALRALNVYGDPSPWAPQSRAVFTVLSFLNTSKYPPSLLFLLMTLGPALLFLWLADRRVPRLLRPALVVGRVPLFYYVLHVALLHALAVVVCYVRYGRVHWMFESPSIDRFPVTQPPGWPARPCVCSLKPPRL